jgi:4-hydroxy-4-methyl-2-oxoglutarate aldolase
MEKHLYHGVVNERIDRPSGELIAQFESVDVAHVVDAMGRYGIMHWEIKPISPGMRAIGPAVTVLAQPGDTLYVAHAADIAQPGDIIVIDAGGVKELCVIGERIGYYMGTKRQVAAVVVDGAIRDVKGLRAQGMPVFTRSVTPNIIGTQGPGAINVPIACGGVTVNPGDMVFGDDDGVVVIPRGDVGRVLELAREHLAGELHRLDQVNQGMTLTEVQNLGPRLDRWR